MLPVTRSTERDWFYKLMGDSVLGFSLISVMDIF